MCCPCCFFIAGPQCWKGCDPIRYRKGETTLNYYFFYCVTTGFLPRYVLLASFRAREQSPLEYMHNTIINLSKSEPTLTSGFAAIRSSAHFSSLLNTPSLHSTMTCSLIGYSWILVAAIARPNPSSNTLPPVQQRKIIINLKSAQMTPD